MFKIEGPLKSGVLRPLVQSCAIWLASELGVLGEEEHPGVLQKVGNLIRANGLRTECLALDINQKVAPSIEKRIESWLVNHVRRDRASFKLQIPHDAPASPDLAPPLRKLLSKGKLKRCAADESPVQGHSARSILGKGRKSSKEEDDLSSSPIAISD